MEVRELPEGPLRGTGGTQERNQYRNNNNQCDTGLCFQNHCEQDLCCSLKIAAVTTKCPSQDRLWNLCHDYIHDM